MKKILSILMLLVAIVMGAWSQSPTLATKDYGTTSHKYLDVANSTSNAQIKNGANCVAFGQVYLTSIKNSAAWYETSAKTSSSGGSYSNQTDDGFLEEASNSTVNFNKGYGYFQVTNTAPVYFWVTGTTSVAAYGRGNNNTITLHIDEVGADGTTLTAVGTDVSVTNNTVAPMKHVSALDASKYYKVTVIESGSNYGRLFQIRFAQPSAPATPYTVTFNAGTNGTCATTSLTEASAGAGVTLPEVTPNSGYVFNGWYTAAIEGTKVGDAGKNYKPSADNTPLYAQYSEIPTPTFALSETSIEVGQTAQIKVTGKDDLDGVTLSDISYGTADIVTVDATTGVVTPVAAGSTTITFNSSAVAGKYKASSGNLSITVTAPKCATPTISPVSFSTDNQEVTITSATDGATIYYTTDGTDPTVSSNEYNPESKPTISSTTTFKAIAVKENYDDSEVATQKVTRTSSAVVASWYFTNWSSATQAGVKGDTEAWSQYEKTNSGGMNFGENGRSNIGAISSGSTLKYNETNNIDETNGLTFAAGAYGLALIFNIGSATVSKKEYTYHGSSYLWLYNENAIITIPSVPAGATIEIGVESHNGGTERGVTLKNGSNTLTQTQGAAASKVYQVCKWTNATAGNVTVNPSAGLHIYYITVTSNVETEGITTDNGVATYVTKNALDFTGLETKAYVVKSVDTKKNKVFTEEVTTVPAGTALLVKGATVNVPVIASATAPATNLLQISTGDGVQGGDNIFAYSKSAKQFKKVASTVTIPSGKCYLQIDGISGSSLDIDLDGEATAINNVDANENANSAAPVKVIKNGKLYIGNYNVAGQLVK